MRVTSFHVAIQPGYKELPDESTTAPGFSVEHLDAWKRLTGGALGIKPDHWAEQTPPEDTMNRGEFPKTAQSYAHQLEMYHNAPVSGSYYGNSGQVGSHVDETELLHQWKFVSEKVYTKHLANKNFIAANAEGGATSSSNPPKRQKK